MENPGSETRRGRVVRYAPLVLWIGVVLFLSSTAGSMSRTSRIIRPVLEFLFPSASDATLVLYHGFVRKFAHFAEYFVLGLLASRAFLGSTRSTLIKYWFIASLVIAVSVASLDEFNQSFNPARTGALADVLLDLTGAATSLLVLQLYRSITKN